MQGKTVAEVQETIIGEIPEQTAILPFPNMMPIAPQGPLRNLSELRAEYPYLEILPPLRSKTIKMVANSIVDIDLPDSCQFIIVTSPVGAMLNMRGRAVNPAANEVLDDLIVISGNANFKMFTGGTRQISLGDYLGLGAVVTVMFYVTDKLVLQ